MYSLLGHLNIFYTYYFDQIYMSTQKHPLFCIVFTLSFLNHIPGDSQREIHTHISGLPVGDPHTYKGTPSGRSNHIQGDSQWEIHTYKGTPSWRSTDRPGSSQVEIHRQTRGLPEGDPHTHRICW